MSRSKTMRLIRRFVLLAIVGAAGVAAYNWSDHRSPLHARATAVEAEQVKKGAVRLANKAAANVSAAATGVRGTMTEGALTAKIKSKMALDDHVKGRAINVDTLGSVVTVTGVVASADERERAVRL